MKSIGNNQSPSIFAACFHQPETFENGQRQDDN